MISTFIIKTTNHGDSGYALFRPFADGTVKKLFRSKEM